MSDADGDNRGILDSGTNIRDTMNGIKQLKVNAMSVEFDHDIAILLVQIGDFNKLAGQPGRIFYDVYRLYLKVQDRILSFAELVYGTYVSIGNGRFLIFSTRGPVEADLAAIQRLLLDIQHLANVRADIGLGYGSTAREAENHARIALNYAEKSVLTRNLFIVSKDGTVNGPVSEKDELSFRFREEDPVLIRTLHQAGVGVGNFHRILSLQQRSSTKTITALSVAEALQMTTRNARKILSSLEAVGLAEIVGQETPAIKGRPRNIFRIHCNL